MKKLFFKRQKFILFLLVFILGTGLMAFRFADDYFQISRNLQIFADVYREANLKYVDNIKPGTFMKKGVDAMLSSLDPYTEYIPESELEDFKMKYVNPEYGGIGAVIFQKDSKTYISDVYEGFPAQKEDIRAGDQILELNGIQVTAKNSRQVSDLLKGQRGTDIRLLLARPGSGPAIEKTVAREEIHLKNVSYSGLISPGIGYIKLDHFLENSANEVRQAFVDLKAKDHITGLILDLRGNGGGILQESVKIVNLFVPKGEIIVTQKGRLPSSEVVYKASSIPVDLLMPIVVLVDRGTASASEIVSGSLQDLDRAIVIGQRSFGKGLVQQTIPLSYNTLMKITVAKYYTPSGRCIQALDYGHRNVDGTVNKLTDSSLHPFRTKSGRVVFDGSGIYPDVKVIPKTFSNLLVYLVNKQFIFDYATHYRNAHAEILAPRDFSLTEEEYAHFLAYLSDKKLDYMTSTEKLLTDLKLSAEKERRFSDINAEYLALKNKLVHHKNEDLSRFRPEIKRFLEMDIVGRYYFQTGKLQASLVDDTNVKESIKVLTHSDLYATVLNGSGKFHSIGGPLNIPDTAALVDSSHAAINKK